MHIQPGSKIPAALIIVDLVMMIAMAVYESAVCYKLMISQGGRER